SPGPPFAGTPWLTSRRKRSSTGPPPSITRRRASRAERSRRQRHTTTLSRRPTRPYPLDHLDPRQPAPSPTNHKPGPVHHRPPTSIPGEPEVGDLRLENRQLRTIDLGTVVRSPRPRQ